MLCNGYQTALVSYFLLLPNVNCIKNIVRTLFKMMEIDFEMGQDSNFQSLVNYHISQVSITRIKFQLPGFSFNYQEVIEYALRLRKKYFTRAIFFQINNDTGKDTQQ